jgi:hypothetical protein
MHAAALIRGPKRPGSGGGRLASAQQRPLQLACPCRFPLQSQFIAGSAGGYDTAPQGDQYGYGATSPTSKV